MDDSVGEINFKEPIARTPMEIAFDLLASRKQAYVQVFEDGEFTKTVITDLERFCRVNESCFHPDPRIHAVLEGRREVMLRIKQHLELSIDELQKIILKGERHE